MANAYRHKRYIRVIGEDSSAVTFTDVDNARTLIGFKPAFGTSSPATTYGLEDAGQTLVATFEFDSEVDQTAFKSAVDAEWGENSTPFSGSGVEHFKTEWVHQDGTISATTNLYS